MSTELLAAFNFREQNTFLHKIDPRVKFIFIISYLIVLFLLSSLLLQLFLLISLLPIILLGKILDKIINSIKQMGFIIFFIIFINTILIENGFNFGLQMCIRFINIIIVFSIFFQTTHPDDLSQALEKIGLPYSIALTISLAFRFVPTIAQETETISEAQRSRGMNIQKGGLIQQIKNLFALLIPLISNSIQRAYYVAESLETRSFSVNNKRTNLFDLKFTKKDVLFSIYFLFFFIVGIILFININQLPNWILYSLPI